MMFRFWGVGAFLVVGVPNVAADFGFVALLFPLRARRRASRSVNVYRLRAGFANTITRACSMESQLIGPRRPLGATVV